MKIGKFESHRSVDAMIQEAIPELQIIRNGDDADWDIFFVDDIITHQQVIKHKITAKRFVWYCHGTYDTWQGFIDYANENFDGYAVLFTDHFKQSIVLNWMKFRMHDFITQKIFLPQCYKSYFLTPKTGGVMTIGRSFTQVARIYHGYETIVLPVLKDLQKLGDKYHHYGDNISESVIPSKFQKGMADIYMLAGYNVAVLPTGCRSVGFALLECLNSGIAVVTTEKYDIPKSEHLLSIVFIKDADECMYAVHKLMSETRFAINIGTKGHEMANRIFNKESWTANVVPWLKSII